MMRSKIVLIVNSKTIVRLLVWICMSRSVRPSDMVQFHSIDLRSHLVAKFMKNHIYNSYKMMMKITQFQQNKPIIYTLYEKILHLHFISRRLSSEKPWETLCNLQSCKQLKFKTFFACLEIGANFHCKRIAYWCNTNNPVHWFDQSELLIYIEDMWSFYTQGSIVILMTKFSFFSQIWNKHPHRKVCSGNPHCFFDTEKTRSHLPPNLSLPNGQ